MSIIESTDELINHCKRLAGYPHITLDTEFLRDRTYYARLCLVQIGDPEGGAVAVDPIGTDVDLQPLCDLLVDENVLKVMHAGRQDIEIFYNLTGRIVHPIFDTQVAAMVCGFGDSIGYDHLVQKVTGKQLDKSSQFTDWSRRPLRQKQLDYALNDVTYLQEVYAYLRDMLDSRGRTHWVQQEVETLTDPHTYQNPPEEAWKRIKIRSKSPKALAILRAVAAWREEQAQSRDVPRNRVLRDETLIDMALHPPKKREDLLKTRNIPDDVAKGKYGAELLEAIDIATKLDKNACPQPPQKIQLPQSLVPAVEMLKMLLRIKSSDHEVAAKLIANQEDLETLARGNGEDLPLMRGWRHEVFGADAQAMLDGEIGLSLSDRKICITQLDR